MRKFFRRKPAKVEGIQFTGTNHQDIKSFFVENGRAGGIIDRGGIMYFNATRPECEIKQFDWFVAEENGIGRYTPEQLEEQFAEAVRYF